MRKSLQWVHGCLHSLSLWSVDQVSLMIFCRADNEHICALVTQFFLCICSHLPDHPEHQAGHVITFDPGSKLFPCHHYPTHTLHTQTRARSCGVECWAVHFPPTLTTLLFKNCFLWRWLNRYCLLIWLSDEVLTLPIWLNSCGEPMWFKGAFCGSLSVSWIPLLLVFLPLTDRNQVLVDSQIVKLLSLYRSFPFIHWYLVICSSTRFSFLCSNFSDLFSSLFS